MIAPALTSASNMRAGCTNGGGLEVEAEKGSELQEKEIMTRLDEDQVL